MLPTGEGSRPGWWDAAVPGYGFDETEWTSPKSEDDRTE